MDENIRADILLATYNGEKYIEKQLRSLLEQSYKNIKIYVSDDASTDGTVDIIKKYQKDHGDKIYLKVNSKNYGNACDNFFSLLPMTKGDVIFFCDQDDIWKKTKVERTLKEFENVSSPLLVHTDLTVIDENDRVLYPSMIGTQKINIKRKDINFLLAQNNVTGCSSAINRALADILKKPEGIPVHDWWIAVTASLFGDIKYISFPTIYYRSHAHNLCGPKDMSSGKYILSRIKEYKRNRNIAFLTYSLAAQLLKKYGNKLKGKDKKMLEDIASLSRKNKIVRIRVLKKYRIFKNGIVRRVGQLMYL